MTLRLKTLLVMTLTLLALVTSLSVVVARIFLQGFQQAEVEGIRHDVRNTITRLNEATTALGRTEWAISDRLRQAIKAEDRNAIASIIQEGRLSDPDLDGIAAVSSSGELLFTLMPGIGHATLKAPALRLTPDCAARSPLIKRVLRAGRTSGLLEINGQILLVAAVPVGTQDNNTSSGSIILMRRLTPETENTLSEASHVPGLRVRLSGVNNAPVAGVMRPAVRTLSASPPGIIETRALTPETIDGFTILQDVLGTPSVLLSITSPRVLYQHGSRSVQYLMRSAIGLGIVFALAVLLLMERLVLAPLSSLKEGVRNITRQRGFSGRLAASGADELASVARDINEMLHSLETSQNAQRESEDRYRTVFEQTSDGIFLVDTETGSLLHANAAFQQLLGYGAEQIAALHVGDFTDGWSPGHGPDELHGERAYRRRDGNPVHVEAGAHAMTSAGRRVLCVVVRDITRRKLAEQELAARHEDLEQIVEERSRELIEAQRQIMENERLASVGQLASGIAHEINTPIQYVGDNLQALSEFVNELTTVIQTYRGTLQQARSGQALTAEIFTALDEREKEADLDFIIEDAPKAITQGLDGVHRVAHIVRAMKDFSHVDREETASVDLNRSVENTLAVARNEYKYVADVTTDFGEIPAVECFGSEINQVLLNIIVNAAHAIADTGQRGTISLRTRAIESDRVEIAIGDTGTGIPEHARARIFDPFFTTKEVGRGTGQGLNIAHRVVVERHGGSLTFETELGKGTTFFIRLPVRSARQESGTSV